MGRRPERLVERANAFCHQGYEIGKAINTNKKEGKKEGAIANFLEGWPSLRSCCAFRVTNTYDRPSIEPRATGRPCYVGSARSVGGGEAV